MQNRKTIEPLSIRLLGGVEVERSGIRITSALHNKGRALLAYLAATPGVAQPRERLAGLLWPQLPEGAARSNLRQTLLNLQRVLGDKATGRPLLSADRQTVGLHPHHHYIDLVEFAAFTPHCPEVPNPTYCASCLADMEAATGCYRGEFLAGFHLDDCPDFEDWRQVQQASLHRHALFLLARIARCHERAGAVHNAVPHALRWAELEPWNEEGRRQAMRLLALNGQTAAALSEYDACCRVLKEELDFQPSPETQALARRIQAGAFERDPQPVPADAPTPSPERRQVTVLYVQFATATDADPDDAMDLLRPALARCRERLQRYCGHVVPTNEGGLLAYFGYPQAQEHASLLSVQGALALAREAFPGLELRLGVHTGLIVSGSDPVLPDAVGATSGLAIALCALAAPGDVVISEASRRLVVGYFEVAPIGVRRLQGRMRPVAAFRVLRASGASHRLEAAAALTPLVGRERELALMERLWEQARDGESAVRLIDGDPGIGKSRLALALRERLAVPLSTTLELRCTPEFSHTPFHPIVELLERAVGFAAADSPAQRFSRLARDVEGHAPEQAAELVPLLAGLLSLPVAPPYRMPAIPAQQLRQRTMAAMVEQLGALTADGPVLLIIEDLHWADPSTLEVLTQIIAHKDLSSLLVLLTARPEFRSPWPESEVPKLPLGPLTKAEVAAMITATGLGLRPDVLAAIAQRADGVPLFAEELAQAAADTASEASASIPASLQDLLAARLDALGEARHVAQMAATIGRDFPLGLLGALSLLTPAELDASLQHLRASGLVSGSSDGSFQFRHALFRDAAYHSQIRSDRQAAHRRIAHILEERFADVARVRPELVARHWGNGGEADQAIDYWLRAGRLAHLRGAHREALGHFGAGLELVPLLPEGTHRAQRELELQVGMGAASHALEGYGSPAGVAAYARAVELGEAAGDSPEVFQALWGVWASASSHSDYRHSLQLARRLLRMARKGGDPIRTQQAHFAVGNIQFWRGEFQTAREHLEQVMSLYTPDHHEALIAGYGENAYATSGAFLSWTLCFLGFPEQALAVGRQAVAEARRVEHPFSLGYALTFLTVLHRMLRLAVETRRLAEETIALAVTHGFPLWETGATLKRGWARVMQDDPEGLAEMHRSVESVRALMSGITLIFLETLADALRRAGRFDEALEVIEEAQAVVIKLDDHHVEAELHRIKGECLLAGPAPDTARAEACFQRALAIARRQGARLLELRAATGIARLWSAQGRRGEAGDLLGTICRWFTEGGELPDLHEARALLQELSRDT